MISEIRTEISSEMVLKRFWIREQVPKILEKEVKILPDEGKDIPD